MGSSANFLESRTVPGFKRRLTIPSHSTITRKVAFGMDYVNQRVQEEAAKTASSDFVTPLNVVLVAAVAYLFYSFFRAPTPTELPKPPPPAVFQTYNPRTLLPFNGENGNPIFFAVRGRVFDVSNGRNFYGPGGPYSNFAGRDASRGLAFGSFDEDMLTEDLDGPLDALNDLTPDQEEALMGWEGRFSEKYPVVGKLVPMSEYNEVEKA